MFTVLDAFPDSCEDQKNLKKYFSSNTLEFLITTASTVEFQRTYFIVKAQKLHGAKTHYILLRENSADL